MRVIDVVFDVSTSFFTTPLQSQIAVALMILIVASHKPKICPNCIGTYEIVFVPWVETSLLSLSFVVEYIYIFFRRLGLFCCVAILLSYRGMLQPLHCYCCGSNVYQ